MKVPQQVSLPAVCTLGTTVVRVWACHRCASSYGTTCVLALAAAVDRACVIGGELGVTPVLLDVHSDSALCGQTVSMSVLRWLPLTMPVVVTRHCCTPQSWGPIGENDDCTSWRVLGAWVCSVGTGIGGCKRFCSLW